MRRRVVSAVIALSLMLSFEGVSRTGAAPESAGVLYERAYFLEQGRGDLGGAVRLYRRIAQEFGDDRKLAARALLRMGICYERLGTEGATQAYRALVERYGDQPEARIAREKLRAAERTASEPEPTGGVRVRQVLLKDGKLLFLPGSLSPDGKSVAYFDWDAMAVNVQSLPSGEIRLLTPPRRDFPHHELRWSPDGKRLAFDADLDGDRVCTAVQIDTGKRTISYHRPGAYAYPVDWGAGGQLLCRVLQGDRRFLAVLTSGQAPLVREVAGEHFRLSPNGRSVAFSNAATEPQAAADIFVLDLAGSGEVIPVAAHPAQDEDPIWSPDGHLLAFRSNRTGSWDLWASDMEDGKPSGEAALLQKDLGAQTSFDSWLPDGRLSYNKVEGLSDIWVLPMSPETGQAAGRPVLVSQVQGRNYGPMWSPDGSRIAYTSNRKGDGKGGFYVTRIDRFQEQEFELPGIFFNPTWSPDGRRFVMIANKPGEGRVFLDYNLATGAASTLLDHPLLKGGSPYGHFSPDGARLLFDGFGAPGESVGLHVYDGSSVTKIPGTEGARPGRWSPDGKWIAFKRGDSLLLIRPDGTGLRQLALAQGPALPGFAWSADGRFIAYATIAPAPSAWTIDIEANTVRRIEGIASLGPRQLAWSPDGRHLAIGSTRGRYQLWVVENLLPADRSGKNGPRQARRR